MLPERLHAAGLAGHAPCAGVMHCQTLCWQSPLVQPSLCPLLQGTYLPCASDGRNLRVGPPAHAAEFPHGAAV